MTTTGNREAILALSDGATFRGRAFGASRSVEGELVFFTSPTGYQEILTDPGSHGQIVVFAYPELGNVGVNDADRESDRIHAAGVVARHLAEAPSSHLAQRSLPEELEAHRVPGIEGIDTRRLVRLLREGRRYAVLSTEAGASAEELVERARAGAARPAAPGAVGCGAPYEVEASGGARHHVVAYDFGIKRSLIRRLSERGCRLTVVPASTPAAEALAHRPDGILLSGGPGDPQAASEAVSIVKELLGRAPILGIGFGHLLLAQAAGARIRGLERSHQGSNHPVKELESGRIAITSHAHRWAIEEESLEGIGAEPTHRSLHDGAVEGIRIPAAEAIGVQFQPEAGPGPRDALAVFDRFTELMEVARQTGA